MRNVPKSHVHTFVNLINGCVGKAHTPLHTLWVIAVHELGILGGWVFVRSYIVVCAHEIYVYHCLNPKP